MDYLEKKFETGSGGAIKLSEEVREKIGEYIISEKSVESYNTVANGHAYCGEATIICEKSQQKDDYGRTVYVTPNEIQFVYKYQNGDANNFDSGRISLFSPIRNVKGKELFLETDGTIIVPDGMIAVRVWDITDMDFQTFGAGETVKLPESEFFLSGESRKFIKTDHDGVDREYLVNNVNGKAEITLHPDQIKSQKKFAEEQIEKLKEMGFPGGVAYAIMKASGPGHCVTATKWAIYAFEKINSQDLLDCVLSGMGGRNSFGWDRMKGAIEALGLKAPSLSSSTAFFKVLKGAHIAILKFPAIVMK